MSKTKLTRRDFILLSGSFAAISLIGISCDSESETETQGTRTVFLLSGRDRRASQAEKKHYANRLYATEDAALADLPHPGARPRVVMITTSKSRFNELFDNGNSLVADLRNF
jgi:hypothetical protein